MFRFNFFGSGLDCCVDDVLEHWGSKGFFLYPSGPLPGAGLSSGDLSNTHGSCDVDQLHRAGTLGL